MIGSRAASQEREPVAHVSSPGITHLLLGMAFTAPLCQGSQRFRLLFLAQLHEGNNLMRHGNAANGRQLWLHAWHGWQAVHPGYYCEQELSHNTLEA